ncbi:MAG: phosphoribosylaminoimidazolesuccinocarboxamide synthase [Planctomycetota bacterium]
MAESSAVDILREPNLPDLELVRSGKVREIFDIGDSYLIVASDRLSAFDVVFPGGIPNKGRVLTQISLFWFDLLGVPHHLKSADVADLPAGARDAEDALRDRFMIVEKLEILPVECIVRGYLAGSGWNEYQERGTICSIPLPEGLQNSSQLPEPIFTPSTKADEGHDENISYEEAEKIVGKERCAILRDRSLEVYNRAAEYALTKGVIIADTKFEWGVRSDGEIVLADEVLTPDSSRFWPQDLYEPGKSQPSFDKQFVRDHLLGTDWDKTPPAPELPEDVVRETSRKYIEIFERITGRAW